MGTKDRRLENAKIEGPSLGNQSSQFAQDWRVS